ncbi:hypothetical protein BDC45DRAFT_497156 [Circinella umbellata]|nr:hypothetical protein BDC45DRAFT_497156 [Circinella umbellata]
MMRFTAVIITMVIIYITSNNNQIRAAPIPDEQPPPEPKTLFNQGAGQVDIFSVLRGTDGTGKPSIADLKLGL